jgi:hypothetical protein
MTSVAAPLRSVFHRGDKDQAGSRETILVAFEAGFGRRIPQLVQPRAGVVIGGVKIAVGKRCLCDLIGIAAQQRIGERIEIGIPCGAPSHAFLRKCASSTLRGNAIKRASV